MDARGNWLAGKPRIFLLAAVSLIIFSIWFADGYMQWVNSDTAGEGFGATQDVAFPQGLRSRQHPHRSRFTGIALSFLPFQTVGTFFGELNHDPVNALYVAQGFMTGAVFLLLVLISAAYISGSAWGLSGYYLSSTLVLLMVTMSLPSPYLDGPLSLAVRFQHQAVMSNYVGTLSIALCVLFPYWRYLCSGKWDDWHKCFKWRTIFYTLVIAAVFSSTSTMLWMGTFAITAIIPFALFSSSAKTEQGTAASLLVGMLKDSRVRPLFLIILLAAVGALAESKGWRGRSALVESHLIEYCKVYVLFFGKSRSARYFALACLALILLMGFEHRKGTISPQLMILARVFPWLVVGNLVFMFLIGMPRIPYRFSGYNLGSDTTLPATWSMILWVLAVIVGFWRMNKLTWTAPILLYILATNSLTYFTFPGYETREYQKAVFTTLYHENQALPLDVVLPVPVDDVAFSTSEIKAYTIPMLLKAHIISSQRKLSVVTKDIYDSWQTTLAKTGSPPLLNPQDK